MYISNHGESCLATELPERPIAGSIEDHDAAIETVWIEIVVVGKALHLPA